MMGGGTAYAPTKGADTMIQLPEYREWEIGNTTYKVTSVFAGKGDLRELYEKYIIDLNADKAGQAAEHGEG